MDRKLAWVEIRISSKMANEIDLIRRTLDDSPTLAEATCHLLLRGLAATWEQTRELCIIAKEKERLSGGAENRVNAHEARIRACDDALSRLARLSSGFGNELIHCRIKANVAQATELLSV